MPQTLFNPIESSTERFSEVNKKRSYISRVMNAYGKIEMTIFFVLFIAIVVLVVAHNFVD